jgi:hypothetical protein
VSSLLEHTLVQRNTQCESWTRIFPWTPDKPPPASCMTERPLIKGFRKLAQLLKCQMLRVNVKRTVRFWQKLWIDFDPLGNYLMLSRCKHIVIFLQFPSLEVKNAFSHVVQMADTRQRAASRDDAPMTMYSVLYSQFRKSQLLQITDDISSRA